VLCISTKGRYSTRILVLLASLADESTMTKHEIATAEALTPGYVQQLMTPLQAAGLVMSHRGKQGGFKLARSPETITVAEALRATEGELRLVACHDGENCDRVATCPTRLVWVEAANLMQNFFGQTTIAQLAERAKEMAVPTVPVATAAGSSPAAGEEKGVRA